MKKFSVRSRVIVALLMAVILIFSVIAVTVSAASSLSNDEAENKPWYNIDTTGTTENGNPKISLTIDPSQLYKRISEIDPENLTSDKIEEEINALMTRVYEAAYDYALAKLGAAFVGKASPALEDVVGDKLNPEVNTAYAGMTIELLDDTLGGFSFADLPDALKDYVKDYVSADGGVIAEYNKVHNTEHTFDTLKDLYQSEEPEAKEELKEVIENMTKNDPTDEGSVKIQEALQNTIKETVSIYIAVAKPSEEEINKLPEKINTTITNTVANVYEKDPEQVKNPELAGDDTELKDVLTSINSSVNVLTNKVETGITEAKENPQIPIEKLVAFAMKELEAITVNGNAIYENGKVNAAAVKEIIKSIPKPDDMRDWNAEQFKSMLSYEVGVKFSFADFALGLEVGLDLGEMGVDVAKAVMGMIADHIDVQYEKGADGSHNLSVQILVPDEFAKVVLKLLQSGVLDKADSGLTDKIFNALKKDGEDFETFIKRLTVDDIIELFSDSKYADISLKDVVEALKKYNYTSDILNIETVKYYLTKYDSKLESLDGKDLEKYINNNKKYFEYAYDLLLKVIDRVPEKLMNKSIMDGYEGDGVFAADVSATVAVRENVDKYVPKVINSRPAQALIKAVKNYLPAQYASKVDVLVANTDKITEYVWALVPESLKGEVTVNLDAEVKFLDIRSVEYTDADGNVEKEGLLPKGADIKQFAPTDESTWIVKNKITGEISITDKMPEYDVIVYPLSSFTAVMSGDINATYGDDIDTVLSVTPNAPFAPEGSTYAYEWYIGDSDVPVSNESTYTIDANAKNVKYKCIIKLLNAGIDIDTTGFVEVNIAKQVLDLVSAFDWSDENLTYTGSSQNVTVTLPGEWGNNVTVVYSGDKDKVNAGNYNTTATFELIDSLNYEFDVNQVLTASQNWSIVPKTITLTDVNWVISDGTNTFNPSQTFTYDPAKKYSIRLDYTSDVSGLDAIINSILTVKVTNGTTVVTQPFGNAGTYQAEIVEVSNSNYTITGTRPASLNFTIDRKIIEINTNNIKWYYTIGDSSEKNYYVVGEPIKYTGSTYNFKLEENLLPSEITDVIYGNDNASSTAGAHNATYTLVYDEANYTVDEMYATGNLPWVIEAESAEGGDEGTNDNIVPGYKKVYLRDENQKVIMIIEVPENAKTSQLAPIYEDLFEKYKKFKFSDYLEKGKKGELVSVYDIVFAKEGSVVDIKNGEYGTFTVKYVVPEEYKEQEEFAVFYIKENGELEKINVTVKDGYATFETNHFSIYALVSVEESGLPWWAWLLIVLAIVIGIAAIVVLVIFIRKKQKEKALAEQAAKEAENTNTTPSVGEAAIEVPDLTSADAESPVNVPDSAEEVEEVEEVETVEEIEDPIAEEVADEVPEEESIAEEPAVEEPAVEEPVAEEPIVEESIVEEPVAEEPVAEEPVAEEPVAEEEPIEEVATATLVDVMPEAASEGDGDSVVLDGHIVYIRYRSSFTSRLIQSSTILQNYYTVIKNHILAYNDIKAKTSWSYEIFSKGRTQCVKLNIKGKSITLNLALDPKAYNVNKYHFVDLSDNPKFAKIPMLIKVKSDRSLKYALELIDDVMKKLGLTAGETPEVDYSMPYESNASLAKRGLVKVVLPTGVKADNNLEIREANVTDFIEGNKSAPTTVEIVESDVAVEDLTIISDDNSENEAHSSEVSVAEEIAVENIESSVPEAEPETTEPEDAIKEELPVESAPSLEEVKEEHPAEQISAGPVIIGSNAVAVGENVVLIRYRSSFTSRLIQSGDDIQGYYTTLKNHLLSYKGIKSRTSWNYETFGKGRVQCARINLKGKTLAINLALVPSSYNATKYHFTDLSNDPKFDKLPMLLKIKSARALKYAIELIDELMKSLEIPQGKIPTVDYRKPFEPNSSLAKRGLVKIILPAGVKLDDATVLREDDKVDAIIESHKQGSEE